jgi:poly-gamma-glutamate capsule biosynthesis protein CapA/YwtB (metallophosphatase superfamily)
VPGSGRVLVFAFGERYSGIARDWVATPSRPGIDLLPDLSRATVDDIAARVARAKKPGDTAVASIHWGGNWGYEIPAAHRDFAHGLIEHAGIDVVHGHSSHHFKGIEVYRERLILYGCGDFLNDYEGIGTNAEYRSELGLMYFPTLEPASGRLLRLVLIPTRIRRMQIQRAQPHEVAWQVEVLNRESRALGTGVMSDGEGGLLVDWRG